MSKKIGIIIKDDLGNPIYGAKTYIGNKDGKRLYDANKGAISNYNGTAMLEVSNIPLINQYVWVKISNKDYESKQLYRSSKSSPYTFTVPRLSQVFDEVIITRKKPKKEVKSSNINQFLTIGLAVLLGGFIIFISRKNKK